MRTQSIDNIVTYRIYGNKRGWVFTPSRFYDIGSQFAVRKALERLATAGVIRRLAPGLYDYPKRHPVLGDLLPNYEQIGIALARESKLKLQPSGAYAANLLGLTEQVPAKIIFLTDGFSRKVVVGKQEIILKKTTPKNMAASGRISGLVIQALRYLGKANVDPEVINKLKKRLSQKDKDQLLKDIACAPGWIGRIFRKIGE